MTTDHSQGSFSQFLRCFIFGLYIFFFKCIQISEKKKPLKLHKLTDEDKDTLRELGWARMPLPKTPRNINPLGCSLSRPGNPPPKKRRKKEKKKKTYQSSVYECSRHNFTLSVSCSGVLGGHITPSNTCWWRFCNYCLKSYIEAVYIKANFGQNYCHIFWENCSLLLFMLGHEIKYCFTDCPLESFKRFLIV